MLTKLQEETLTGLMLGDGCLEKHKNGRNACLRITRKRTDKAYLELHAIIFGNYGAHCKDGQVFDKRTQKIYHRSSLRTPVNTDFTEWYHEWYINGKKQIPSNIILTPLILATWFADDGSIIVEKRKYMLKLATHGFLKKEVLFLKKRLLTDFGIKAKMYKDSSGKKPHWILMLTNKASIRHFTQIIDPFFPREMERKSNIWRSNQLLIEKTYPPCIYCGSDKVSKNGSSNTNIQKYMCNKCRRQFIDGRSRKIYTKLTPQIIQTVQKLYSSGKYTQKELSDKLSISTKTISNILSKKYD